MEEAIATAARHICTMTTAAAAAAIATATLKQPIVINNACADKSTSHCFKSPSRNRGTRPARGRPPARPSACRVTLATPDDGRRRHAHTRPTSRRCRRPGRPPTVLGLAWASIHRLVVYRLRTLSKTRRITNMSPSNILGLNPGQRPPDT